MVVGLTGGIGSGKSTAAAMFAELGVPVIDADEIARELVVPGAVALDEIRDAFGDGVLAADGGLDRRRLREAIFGDAAAKRRLESILHPRVYEELGRRLEGLGAPYAIVVVPLLLETGGRELVDRVLVVDVSRRTQIARTRSRDGVSREEVEKILEAQTDRDARLEAADDVLDNEADTQTLRARVRSLHERYLGDAGRLAGRRRVMKE